MADIKSKLEIGVTTGAIRGSNEVHVGPHGVAWSRNLGTVPKLHDGQDWGGTIRRG